MWPVLIAFGCSLFACMWSLRYLRGAATAVNFDPTAMTRGIRMGNPLMLRRLDEAMGAHRDTWEAEMVGQLARAPTWEHARAEANAALLDIDNSLSSEVRGHSACARIAVFGCLMGVALLIADGAMLTVTVIDVFAIGACGVLVALAAGKEAQAIVRARRVAVDRWVDRLLASRWPEGSEGQGSEGPVVQEGNFTTALMSKDSPARLGAAAPCHGLRRGRYGETVATRSSEELR